MWVIYSNVHCQTLRLCLEALLITSSSVALPSRLWYSLLHILCLLHVIASNPVELSVELFWYSIWIADKHLLLVSSLLYCLLYQECSPGELRLVHLDFDSAIGKRLTSILQWEDKNHNNNILSLESDILRAKLGVDTRQMLSLSKVSESPPQV